VLRAERDRKNNNKRLEARDSRRRESCRGGERGEEGGEIAYKRSFSESFVQVFLPKDSSGVRLKRGVGGGRREK
jgi:hypothetical protein